MMEDLSDFIDEQEKWLDDWLSALGWTRNSLEVDSGLLVQCPFCCHHYVPESSLDRHVRKCAWAISLGTNIHSLEDEDVALLGTDSKFLYEKTNAEVVRIEKSVKDAVRNIAKYQPELGQNSGVRDRLKMAEHFSSLESSTASPRYIHDESKERMISYIKSWKSVPQDFTTLDSTSLNAKNIKGWLFKNLPEKHAHSSVLGGEISMVDSIMANLRRPAPHLQKAKRPSLSPDALMNSLKPLLGLKTRSLVLSLWKFLHISQIQEECGISDSAVDDIAPMATSETNSSEKGRRPQEEDVLSIAKLVQDKIEDDTARLTDYQGVLALPAEAEQLSTNERRILYDYIVEVTSRQAFMRLDADLYRDDMAAIKAQLKAQGKAEAAAKKDEEPDTSGKTYLQLLKEKRDYKRRRQKYRAKNVHITRKTPTEIFRTIIRNRMEEMRAAMEEGEAVAGDHGTLLGSEDVGVNVTSQSSELTLRTGDSEEKEHQHGKRHRKSRSRSRSRLRERSRDREHWTSRDKRGHLSQGRRGISPEKDKREQYRKKRYRRSRSRSKSRSRDRDFSASKERRRSSSRDRRRDRSKDRTSKQSQERDRDREKHREESRGQSKERRRSGSRGRKSKDKHHKKQKKHKHRSRSHS